MFAIVLNTLLITDPTAVLEEADKQLVWLQETLVKAAVSKKKWIVVFQHHPWFLEHPEEDNQYFNIDKSVRKKYLTLFKQYGVSHIFAGHLHKNSFGRDEDLEMVTTGPVGRPLGADPSGIRIGVYDKENLKHQYYALDSIPPRISND